MKKIILSIIILIAISTSSKTFAQEIEQSKQQTKIVHPTIPMSADSLNRVLNRMRQQANDEAKLTVFKQGLKGKGAMVDQVITLMNQFLADSSKLNAAMYAYEFSVDYKNYQKIKDSFGNEESKQRLEEYINKQRKKTFVVKVN